MQYLLVIIYYIPAEAETDIKCQVSIERVLLHILDNCVNCVFTADNAKKYYVFKTTILSESI